MCEPTQSLFSGLVASKPISPTQSVRTFGKSADGWLCTALGHLLERLKTIILTIINAFAMTLRCYTPLNHLAQTSHAVLLNATQVNRMLADLNEITLQNKLTIYDRINSSNGLVPSISIEHRNVKPKISLVVKKDTLSPAQI
ncbi:unnamed protein product [Rotaria magnacalcarata]|uniref:RFX1-4/6/8-like BCD domain-containing protein n=1 Tax=Rotaria magnacalcarata TaxID=392030 RepID=A0A8S2M2T4_9BILA|nr:unnamed protein product [Rotaria magnacalcarata]CAF3920521.1 unnamed protein product [Rotaria magnacalcarata]CAF4373670.1 unnamed protein product [Rotaria magnacalcarata]